MAKILEFIVAHMSFLWVEARFKITGSEVSTSNGGDGLLLVESGNLRLRFICDRTQLFLDPQPIDKRFTNEWYSIDLVRRLLLGQREVSSFLDASYAEFIRENQEDIERRFSNENWEETRSALRVLRAKRAKETFG